MLRLHPVDSGSALYAFDVTRSFLTMKDGTNLSVTYALPQAKVNGEKHAALADPSAVADLPCPSSAFSDRDCPYFAYFASRGFAVAKVDIRGTGSSFGRLVEKEYTNVELNDGAEVIELLSALPWSNGNIGMYGISWGAFNALMEGTFRQPPALKAIYVVHGSHDLYYIDIHYPDGILHFDEYILSVDHEDALPQSLQYPVDSAFISNRFNTTAWSDVYLGEQKDGEFWREHSVMYNYSALTVPTYLVGGFYDTYVDFAPSIYENIKNQTKARVAIGPWDHAWPEEGSPGPNYDGKREAVRWFNAHLRNQDDGILSEPEFAVYVRESYAPDPNLATVPGQWRYEDWPIQRTTPTKFFLSPNHTLARAPRSKTRVDSMKYKASAGQLTEAWPQQLVGNQIPADQNDGALVYISLPLSAPTTIIGFVGVHLNVTADASAANWIIRLEDMDPTGTNATLVASTAFNGNQRDGRDQPKPIEAMKFFELRTRLHFTSWTFPQGHRIRIAVVNSAMRRSWPSPFPMNTFLSVGGAQSYVEFPIVPPASTPAVVPQFTQQAYVAPAQCSYAEDYTSGLDVVHDETLPTGAWTWVAQGIGYRTFDNAWVSYLGQNFSVTDDANPAEFVWSGLAVSLVAFETSQGTKTSAKTFQDQVAALDARFSRGFAESGVAESSDLPAVSLDTVAWLQLETTTIVRSNTTHFISSVLRELYANGTLLDSYQSDLTFPRQFQ